MARLMLTPPVAFLILLATTWLLSQLLSRVAFRPKKQAQGSRESYACGEKNYNNMAQPDYSTFFAFAFFFTLAHVATLVMATVTTQVRGASILAAIYIIGAIMGLYILFRK